MQYRVYDKNDEYFPLIEADEVDVMPNVGTFFKRGGMTVAYFSEALIGGFQEEEKHE